jgi:hypothetical protein
MAANYIITRTKKFWRAFGKLTVAEQDLVMAKIDILRRRPVLPVAKNQKIKGQIRTLREQRQYGHSPYMAVRERQNYSFAQHRAP